MEENNKKTTKETTEVKTGKAPEQQQKKVEDLSILELQGVLYQLQAKYNADVQKVQSVLAKKIEDKR
jgi:hypothetical protein